MIRKGQRFKGFSTALPLRLGHAVYWIYVAINAAWLTRPVMARAKQMEDDQRDGRKCQHPEQLVAVLRAEDRVGRDAGAEQGRGGGGIDWLSWRGTAIRNNFIHDTLGFGYDTSAGRWRSGRG